MSPVRLIVCEKTTRWAVAFRAALGLSTPLVETRSLSQCAAELRSSPWSIAAVEVSAANSSAALEFTADLGKQFPNARWVILLDADAEATESLWREAGALQVLVATQQALACARLIRRRLAQAPPPVEPNLQSALASRLPWARWASTGAAPPS